VGDGEEMTGRLKIRLLLLAVLLLADRAAIAQQANGAIFAASDGKGQISLLWFPPPSQWPAGGWKLSDSTGQTLAAKIAMADASALQALSVEDADAIRRLPAVMATHDASPKRAQLFNIIGLRALTDPGYARALGIAWTGQNVAAGSRTYTVQGLDASGNPAGPQLTSVAVDASVATALPPSPDGVQSKSDERGVLLSWPPPAENRQLPAIAYVVERDGGGQTGAAVTAKPVIPGVRWDAKIPLVLDSNAPPNEMLTYRVYCVDAFGRRSAPASIKIFFPDFHALEPPHPVTAASGAGKIVVSWPAAQKPNLAGYVVERAMLFDGPYEALSAQALPPDTSQYEDDAVQGGAAYYYRVRAVNSRGDLGTPSAAATVQAKNPVGPPKVDGLAADAGQTRVRLTWKPVEFPVAGYFVERRVVTGAVSAEQWVRLNARVTPEPLYDDALGMTSDVSMEYRVLAVAFDNAEGTPSNSVRVVVADQSIPEPPSITASSGADGKSQISFVPALPAERTAQFLVLRSGSQKDLGVVIGDPLTADARQFTDLYVSPGERYWYRLVGVGKNGNRSDPTEPVAIRVGSPQMVAPPAPTASYSTDPYPHVVLQFPMPPAGLSVIVERQEAQSDAWIRIAGPMATQSATDNSVPASRPVSYRLSYVSDDGKVGPAGPVATVSAKQ
jgi:hypothetical protein